MNLIVVALLFRAVPIAAQGILPRWELTIRGADTTEMGDLRFQGPTGRVLLQHADRAFQPLQDLRIVDGRISFVLAASHRRFVGIIADSLSGVVYGNGREIGTWSAVAIGPPGDHWPVPPRITARQLVMGSVATSERMPTVWLTGGPDSAALEREYQELAAQAAVAPMTGADRAARAGLLSLGLNEDARDAARAVLEQIGRSDAADANFRAIFVRDGNWKLDLHDAMLREAPHYLIGFQLSRVADALRQVHELGAEATDSASIRQSAWRYWSGLANDSAQLYLGLNSLRRQNPASADALEALLAGYNDAAVWWRRAVSWLLTHPWLSTAQGDRSPAQLMATFWGVDSLPIPEIRDARFGSPAAMPLLSVQRVAPWLFTPGNAIAAEWLPQGGVQAAFAVWRPLRWGESPLTVVIGGRQSTVASPASQALVHPASFFGDRDAIRIDPGMMPLAAVAAFLHEWNHLLAMQHRLAGPRPPAVVQTGSQLQLLEDDPWLAEGFAEWATDEVLRPAGTSAAFLRFTQADKRLGIADANPTDPHVLGYRFVRTAARTFRVPALRDMLVNNLHDFGALRRALALPATGAGGVITLQRPATSIVIPEITFTWEDGTAVDLSRRLVLPNTPLEH